jgi:hypothetical protein
MDRGIGLLRPKSFLLVDGSNELVSSTPDRSHEAGTVGIIVEGLAEFVDGVVQLRNSSRVITSLGRSRRIRRSLIRTPFLRSSAPAKSAS